MKVTNKYGMPSGFYNACLKDEYVRVDGSYSATELLRGIPNVMLERRYQDDIEQDCTDMIWMIWGTAVHHIMETYAVDPEEHVELTLKREINDVLISGHTDLYIPKEKCVADYKTCSSFKIMYKDYEDWKKQLLIYAWMLRGMGYECNSGFIVALIKDHTKTKAKRDSSYPQVPAMKIKFRFREKDFDELEAWLFAKTEEIKKLEKVDSKDLPPCSPKDRWAKEQWAVMKKGRKSAVRVFNSEEEASANIALGDYIEHRIGEDVKCDNYCMVNNFCPYYQSKVGLPF